MVALVSILLPDLDEKNSVFLQEVVFYEDGEPIIDGEPGDLKVSSMTLPTWFSKLNIHGPCSGNNCSHFFCSSVSAQQLTTGSKGKATIYIQLSLSHWYDPN